MNEEITLFQLIITGGIPVGGVIAAWINMRLTVAGLKQQIIYLEKKVEDEKSSNKENYASVSTDIKAIFKILTEIKVQISKA